MTAPLETQTAAQTPSGPARLLDRVLSSLLRLPAAGSGYRVVRDVPPRRRTRDAFPVEPVAIARSPLPSRYSAKIRRTTSAAGSSSASIRSR